jgi:hypothetical protein
MPSRSSRTRRELELETSRPIERRCLTESGMPTKTTTSDWITVGVFLAVVIAMLAWVIAR